MLLEKGVLPDVSHSYAINSEAVGRPEILETFHDDPPQGCELNSLLLLASRGVRDIGRVLQEVIVEMARTHHTVALEVLRAVGERSAHRLDNLATAVQSIDRKSVGEGKSVSVRVDTGGRR